MADSSEELLRPASGALGSQEIEAVAKAYYIGDTDANGSKSQILHEPDKQQSLFQASGALQPLYDPAGLAIIYENSSSLRSCVDAMVTNIDSFGHGFLPVIDLTQEDAKDKVRTAMRIERKEGKLAGSFIGMADEPTDAEVDKRFEDLKTEIAEEKAVLDIFFANCTIDIPFAGPEGLRGLIRTDLEVQGNAYVEVLRDGEGRIGQFNHVPASSVRLWPLDDKFTVCETTERTSLLTSRKKTVYKKFRRFVQCWEANTRVVYFKELGDPRIVSARTGRAFVSQEEFTAAEGDAPVATELLWLKITSQRTVYGAPRWIGCLLAVLGTRQSEEGNFIYFENRSVPPLAVLVSGGRLHSDSVAKLESHIQNNIKGARNNHKILILEAEKADSQSTASAAAGAGAQARMKIEIVPLTDSQQKDALFSSYEEHNADKIGQAFRLPRLLRGDVRDFNRSCYSEDTETLTDGGWKLQQDIGPKDKIAAYNKDTGEVVFVVPAKKLVYDVVDEEMYHFWSDRTDFCVTGDHTTLWLDDPLRNSQWTVSTASSMSFGGCWVPAAGRVDEQHKELAKEVDISIPDNFRETYVSRKSVSKERYTGKVYCFSVPGYGFFVTRRNGKPAIQGNTAEASIDFAEVQVFSPIRQDFDWMIQTRILAPMGIKYHMFRSNSPSVRDPSALSLIIERLVKANVLTPFEARTLCSDVFNQDLPVVDAPWTHQPISLTLSGRQIEDNLATSTDEAARYHDDQVVPAGGKDGKVDGLGEFVNNGGYSAAGSGSTQESLGVDNGISRATKPSTNRVGKEFVAGQTGKGPNPTSMFDEDLDDEGEIDEVDRPSRGAKRPRQANALKKLQKHAEDLQTEDMKKAYESMERQVITLPAAEFEALFVK